MNLTGILADAYQRLGFPATPAAATTTRLTSFANEVQQEIMSEPGMEYLLNDLITIASVASQQQYSLTPAAVKIKQMWDTTNRRPIYPMSVAQYRLMYPSPSAITGVPQWYVDLGLDAVDVEPVSALRLFVKSSSAADTMVAYFEGYRTGGVFVSESITLTGVTAVGSVATDVINVTKFYLASNPVGTVTLTSVSGTGVVLASVTPTAAGVAYARYRHIALAPTPAAAVTYQVEVERDVTNLVNGTDEPVIPTKFHRLIGLGIRRKEYENKDNTRYAAITAEYTKALNDLKYFVFSQAAGDPNLRGGAGVQNDLARQRLTAY